MSVGARKAALTAMALALVAGTASAQNNTAWFIDESKLPFDGIDGIDTQRLWGVHAGSGYRIEVPADWNGDLVLYAHGYRGTGLELTVSNPSIREHLISEGYAWAASSYSANNYVPGVGAKDTHKLIGLFVDLVGNPERVFITGHSMGGHVTGVAIEQWPDSFRGAVPMCGVMGDNELFDYYQDAYLLAEYYAGKVPVAVPTPDDYYTSPTGFASTAAALGPAFPYALNANGLKYQAATEQLTGGERPIFDQGWVGIYGGAFIFLFQSAGTGPGRENVDTVYQLDSDPALSPEELALNAAIPRIAADAQYRHPNGLGILPGSEVVTPPISGDISIPVVSMHTLGELFVPFHMEQIYAERVASHGASDLLVVRAIRDTNHCGFTTGEQVQAFDDMIEWVETGVKPAGDAVLDPATVADPAFGCQFTQVDRPGLPACP
jgi:pimeloyl-ACP methyl ester carboxylesterase